MEQRKNVSVIGGDKRLFYAAKRLAALGYTVLHTGTAEEPTVQPGENTDLAGAVQNEILLFGLPFTKDGFSVFAPFAEKPITIDTLCDLLDENHVVLAGMIPPETALRLRNTGARVIDYYTDEAFTRFNAILTAEALTGILIHTLPCALQKAEIGVTGYGRIGSILARNLRALGAKVTVFARRSETRLQAEKQGAAALPFENLSDRCGLFRALVNTVPAPILGYDVLKNLPRSCVLIEAAGAPYGIDEAAAKALGFTYISAPGLPGKYAPESAGAAIADAALRLLSGGEKEWNP